MLGLERCAGEVVAEMLDVVENSDPDEAQMQLVMIGKLKGYSCVTFNELQNFQHFWTISARSKMQTLPMLPSAQLTGGCSSKDLQISPMQMN